MPPTTFLLAFFVAFAGIIFALLLMYLLGSLEHTWRASIFHHFINCPYINVWTLLGGLVWLCRGCSAVVGVAVEDKWSQLSCWATFLPFYKRGSSLFPFFFQYNIAQLIPHPKKSIILFGNLMWLTFYTFSLTFLPLTWWDSCTILITWCTQKGPISSWQLFILVKIRINEWRSITNLPFLP